MGFFVVGFYLFFKVGYFNFWNMFLIIYLICNKEKYIENEVNVYKNKYRISLCFVKFIYLI